MLADENMTHVLDPTGRSVSEATIAEEVMAVDTIVKSVMCDDSDDEFENEEYDSEDSNELCKSAPSLAQHAEEENKDRWDTLLQRAQKREARRDKKQYHAPKSEKFKKL